MIFTDGRTPIESPEDFQPVSDNIKETNVSLSIIGFGFANDEDQSQAFKDSQRGCTESILSKFVNSVDGIIVPSGSILDALHEFHKRQVAQVSKCRCELTIGTQLAIPIWVYLKTKKETLPSLKKRSRVGSNGSVKMSRAHFRVDDPEGPEVFIDNRIKGYKYGKDLVPLGEADEAALKFSSEKCLTVIGSIKQEELPRHLLTSHVEAVAAEPNNDSATQLASTLIRALFEAQSLLIARYVWRNNAQPRLVALSPKISYKYECLYLNYLPFNEDMRDLLFPPLDDPTNEQLAVADSLISHMDLTEIPSDDVDENGYPIMMEGCKPSKTFNPSIQRFHQFLLHHGNQPDQTQDSCDDRVPPLDPKIESYLRPLIESRSAKVLENMKTCFPIKPGVSSDDKKSSKKIFWRKFIEEKEKMITKIDVKKIKIDEEEEKKNEKKIEKKDIQISTMDPVRDFNKFISTEDTQIIYEAMNQMTELINRCATQSLGSQLFPKAIECLKALRNACITNSKTSVFNSCIISLRDKCKGKKKKEELWQMMMSQNLTLISVEEELSGVSVSEAHSFFIKTEDAPPVEKSPSAVAETGDDDDLLDLIE
eukprot:GHVL01043276.1.p1 GENE.GHVL01043276.1~~GHVL01043276.1.p1  ORF type:complete len:595 (+),score=144.45 GHVL01043276.1:385-2169(+)